MRSNAARSADDHPERDEPAADQEQTKEGARSSDSQSTTSEPSSPLQGLTGPGVAREDAIENIERPIAQSDDRRDVSEANSVSNEPQLETSKDSGRLSFFRVASRMTRHLWKNFRGETALRAVTSLPESLSNFFAPVLTGALIDAVVGASTSGKPWMTAAIYGGAYIGVQVVRSLSNTLQTHFQQMIGAGLEKLSMSRFITRTGNFNFQDLAKPEIQKEIHTLRGNAQRLGSFTDRVFTLGTGAVGSIAAGFALAQVSPILALAIVGAAAPLLIGEIRRAKVLKENEQEIGEIQSGFWPSLYFLTNPDQLVLYKIMGKQKWGQDRAEGKLDDIANLRKQFISKSTKYNLFFSAVNSVVTLGSIGVVLYSAFQGAVSAGEVGQFLFAAFALQGLVGSVSSTFGQASQDAMLVEGLTEDGAERRTTSTEEQARIDRIKKQFLEHPPTIRFQDVVVEVEVPRKENGKKTGGHETRRILDIDELEFEPGALIGIVGERGSGKTTLLRSILGVQPLTSGRIVLDSNGEQFDVAEVPDEAWHSVIGYQSQEPVYTYSFSVLEAVEGFGLLEGEEGKGFLDVASRYGLDDILLHENAAKNSRKREKKPLTEEESRRLLRVAEETKIGKELKGGRQFSGGENATIALGRIEVSNRPFLMMDEPTANLDARNALKVNEEIVKRKGDVTQLVVSHVIPTIRKADRIIVMEDGKVVASGTHEELLADDADDNLYAEFFSIQRAGYE